MMKLDWHEPNFISQRNFSLASDTSTVNIYLLRKKYNIAVSEHDGILFRRYNGAKINRNGYGFPLSTNFFDLNAAIELLKADSLSRGENLRFCLCNEVQRAEIDKFCNVDWHFFDGDSDYIYKRGSLAELTGRNLHRKKNFFNRFMKTYSEIKFLPITTENLPEALNIAENWASEHDLDDSLRNELSSIYDAANNWQNLGMRGGILYANGEPAAMVMFSVLSEQCIDLHFKKSTKKFAVNGSFTAIIKFLASLKELEDYEYINFEEDMGIVGLKNAKSAYRPEFKLKKYYGEVFV
ncbi:MAG: DUF2156 domain-containing protein [Selenomonadaceae bacterium]|nr:DUF2156 domain-containing protein [Selenomonadaceae bacterium]